MPLTAQQIAQYYRDGYVCPVPVMPASEAQGMRRQLEACRSRENSLFQIAGPWGAAGGAISIGRYMPAYGAIYM